MRESPARTSPSSGIGLEYGSSEFAGRVRKLLAAGERVTFDVTGNTAKLLRPYVLEQDMSRLMGATVVPELRELALSVAAVGGECRARHEPMLDDEKPQNSRSVFDLCAAEAALGDAEAMYFVSFFYFGFDGFERDESRGVALTRSAAEKGYAQAQYWVGWQHETGGHLRQDDSAARLWYERSAAAGFCMASDRIARAYRNGELGLQANPAKAQSFGCKK